MVNHKQNEALFVFSTFPAATRKRMTVGGFPNVTILRQLRQPSPGWHHCRNIHNRGASVSSEARSRRLLSTPVQSNGG